MFSRKSTRSTTKRSERQADSSFWTSGWCRISFTCAESFLSSSAIIASTPALSTFSLAFWGASISAMKAATPRFATSYPSSAGLMRVSARMLSRSEPASVVWACASVFFSVSAMGRFSVGRGLLLQPQLLHELGARGVVPEHRLDLLAEGRDVPQRSLQRRERLAQVEQLLQLRHLVDDALRAEVVELLEVELHRQRGVLLARELVGDRDRRREVLLGHHLAEVLLV